MIKINFRINFLKSNAVLILIFSVFTRCAQMLPLSGGDKDTEPPKVLTQNPSNLQLNFSGDRIQIEFDEYIQLKDIQNQLIISPQLNSSPETEIKGKTLTVTFKDPLKPSTTYQINFGNSIADIHEGNILSDYAVVFSTGNFLDSVSLNGNIIDAFSRKARNDVSVFLYKNGNDSSCFKDKPDYFSRADKQGTYKFSYLNPGKYKIIAFNDKNRNFVYEQEEEDVDEWSSPEKEKINLIKNEVYNFKMYKYFGERFFLKKVWYDEYGKARFCFNRPLEWPSALVSNKEKYILNFSKNSDTLIVFYNSEISDTNTLILKENGRILDTLKLIKPPIEKKSVDASKGILKPKITSAWEEINDSSLFISTNTAFRKFNHKNINIKSSDEKVSVVTCDSINTNTIRLQLSHRVNDGEIMLLPNAIESWLGEKNDTCSLKFTMKNFSTLGTINLNISLNKKVAFILQLLNESGSVLHEKNYSENINVETKLRIDFIRAGNYKLRFIEDKDQNRKWSSGDYMTGKKPEKVFYYDKPVEIISEWETNVEWKIEN